MKSTLCSKSVLWIPTRLLRSSIHVRRTIHDIREITGKQHSDDEIYAVLKECSMDPNETAQKLLYLDKFRKDKRKREGKEESFKGKAAEERPTIGLQRRGSRGGGQGNYASNFSSDDGGGQNYALRESGALPFLHKGRNNAGSLAARMKEGRSKKKTEDESDISSLIKKLRKVEAKKNAEKEKALHMSKLLEEQGNNVQDDSDEEERETTCSHNLAGVKVLHGIDKIMEGGAVVLTLKDQNILANGDVNEEVDMLENVEIGEQKRRDDAYKAAEKKHGTYNDKFNDDPYSEERMLPQYDDPTTDEGVTLDERGHIAGEAEKKLAELQRRLDGASSNNRLEDLGLPGKISSEYYTPEEMLQFKKPRKKKSLLKKDKLDVDALEADAIASGLGVGDLGSRRHAKRQVMKENHNEAEADKRDHAYKVAYAKADEASKSLRLEQTHPVKSLVRARKLALTKKEEAPSSPEAVILLASTISKAQDEKPPTTGESTENKVVFSEMEEFVWSLQLGEETQEINNQDVFMEEDEEPLAIKDETKDEAGGWTEVNDTKMDENPSKEEEEIVPDEIIHEVAVGKGLSGALKLLQERGMLKETIDWGGRNMDKKKCKLVGIVGDDEPKETQQALQRKDESRTSSSSHSKDTYPTKVYHEKDIRIERTDEFGRILTPKEAFRILSHKFHGKGPGKMKQEKRRKRS